MISQGPNTLNLANYRNTEQRNQQDDENEGEEYNEEEQLNIQEQFDNYAKDVQKYDQILAKIAKSINQISGQQYFITDFYPQFVVNCTYDSDQQRQFIINTDIELGKLMENLQRSNKNLKEELKGWLFEYAKKTRLSEVLLTENKLLRKYVTAKNKDIVKMIKELNTLGEELNELKQENGVLMDHVKEMKSTLKQREGEQKKLIQAYQKVQKQKLQLKTKLQVEQDEQQHYSKILSLNENASEEMTRREKNLKDEKSRLIKIRKQYEEDRESIERQVDNCKIDREDLEKYLKSQFKGYQNEKHGLIGEIEAFTQKMQKIQQQTAYYEQQLNRYENKIQQYTNMCSDLDKKIMEVQEVLKISVEESKKLNEIVIEDLTDIEIMNCDIDVGKEEMKQMEEMENIHKENNKKQLKELQQEKNEEHAKWNEEYKKTQSKMSRTVVEEKANLAVKKREIEQYERKMKQKKNQIQELKKQIIEYKENQIQLTNLKQKLKEGKKNAK